MILREFKKIKIGLIYNWVYRSSVRAVSSWQGVKLQNTLWRCTSTEWNRKAPSLSSPDAEEIFFLLLLVVLYLRFLRPQRLRKRLRFYYLGHLRNMSKMYVTLLDYWRRRIYS